ncbi:DUF1566 domain-containing protein [Spirochaeta lutea]|uniref:DUF1566 domain-containing protein n=1 Tax=Spirochaeta lutea TaxID=1480694 RepID=A0A098QUE0_9SPIO|nr:DUF1566 domain-containing protein [Spirochaeta lutea]KGE71201.1 hypothetical protein DC28_12115 [Spirochaeta lutea]
MIRRKLGFGIVTACIVIGLTGCDILGLGGSAPNTYSAGDTGPAGGIIVFVDTSNDYDFDYLEAAPAALDDEYPWGAQISTSGLDDGIGSGQANTTIIIETQDDDKAGLSSYAAKAADNHSTGGFSDWFLPSYQELQLLYTYRSSLNLGGSSDYYWASSQFSQTLGDAVRFDKFNGEVNPQKTVTAPVWPMRAFSE